MDKLYTSVSNKAKAAGQHQVLRFWDSLDVIEQACLCDQINSIDFNDLNSSFSNANLSKNCDFSVEPLEERMMGSSSDPEVRDWEETGMEAIRNNLVGVILLAGGQGTRLGSSDPKAVFNVGLPSNKSLIELQAQKLKKLESLAEGKIRWYIMTSSATDEIIKETFHSNNFYGLDQDQIVFFCQGNVPCLSEEGDVLLKERHKIAVNPDGNGGLYKALQKEDIMSDMNSNGIEHLFVYCVDNILVKIADPKFIGFCITKNADCGNKVVRRIESESVGITCLVNGKPGVIEYTEMSEEIREEKTKNDQLVYDGANICIHYFKKEFLSRIVEKEFDLPVHIARKKIPHITECGSFMMPDKPNGVKLEKFVFDAFQFSDKDKFVVYMSDRNEEFSPLKNATGVEGTPDTCRSDIMRLHAKWLLEAGAEIVGPDGDVLELKNPSLKKPAIIEISPLVSYSGEGLEKLVMGKILSWPLHFTQNKHYF